MKKSKKIKTMNHQNNSGIQNQPDYHIEIERKNMVRLLDERIDKVYGSLLGPMKKKNIDKIRINSLLELEKSTPTILNVSFGGVKGEVLTSFLGMYEIYVSTGSACSSRRGNSRIIESLGVPNEQVEGAIRFSFSIDNTVEEVDIVIQKLIECVTQIRMMK